MPSENFTGVDGSRPRLPSAVHSQAKPGASKKINSGFSAPYCDAVSVRPNTSRSITRSANRVIEAAVCSNSDQNTTLLTISTINAIMRRRSTALQPVLINAISPTNTAIDKLFSNRPRAAWNCNICQTTATASPAAT